MKKTSVAVIGTVGVPASYGGFETLAEHLAENLGGKYDLHIYCSGRKYARKDRVATYKNSRLHYIPLDANGVQSIPYDTWSILHALFYADVLLILGVPGAWLLPFVRWFTNKRIIISIDGIEWKRDKWNILARWYLFWAEGLAVKYSHIDISDNEAIQDYTAMRYGSLSRIIEYGADHTISAEKSASTKRAVDSNEYPFMAHPYAFKVCRIEPENNVHLVLGAFARMEKYRLVMVGNWDNSEYGRDLKARYANVPNITILDPIYDQKKLDLIRSQAVVYIHGHSAGGTNPSLVEAMYLGLPIIAFGVSYNRVTTEGKALYFQSEEELMNIISNSSLSDIRRLGQVMGEVASRRYTWKNIAHKYELLIAEALETRRKPVVSADYQSVSYNDLLNLGLSHLKHADNFYIKR
jgi:glycosyltransferase involved in cell wall biosynthesis